VTEVYAVHKSYNNDGVLKVRLFTNEAGAIEWAKFTGKKCAVFKVSAYDTASEARNDPPQKGLLSPIYEQTETAETEERVIKSDN
jgi:hypothetical protein